VTPKNRLFAVMATSFLLLGMPMAAMGVAWPSAAEDLGRALGELGLVTFAYGAGYTLSTLVSGELTRRFTTGPLLVTAAFVAAGSLVALTLTSIWLAFLLAAFLLGIAGGLLDSGVNAYVAVHRGARSMGIIHTGFGIGSAIGPLLVTVLLAVGASWKIAFASLAAADFLLAVAFVVTVGALDQTERQSGQRPTVDGKGVVLGLSVAVFFLYAGVAAGTGAWSFSLLTEGRGISAAVAGLAVAGYWGGMTVSRVALGILGDRIDPRRTLTASGVATVISLLVLWIAPTPWLGIVALIFSGFAHGSIFPLEMILTARRFGATYTPWAVGYEIAGANVGVAVVSGAMGLLVSRWDISIVAPVLFSIAVMLLVAIEALRMRSASVSAVHV
jgi:fucose permease